jgi:hypothetical protein
MEELTATCIIPAPSTNTARKESAIMVSGIFWMMGMAKSGKLW